MELASDGSIAAKVLAIASSRAELPEVATDGDAGKGTSLGGKGSGASAALQ